MSRLFVWSLTCILGILASCSSPTTRSPSGQTGISQSATAAGKPMDMPRSRWVPVNWSDLPGWGSDPLNDAWPVLQRNCQRPRSGWTQVCAESKAWEGGDARQRQQWLESRLQPYRIEAQDGRSEGLLTAYYEPLLVASRIRRAGFEVPLYAPPAELTRRGDNQPWYTRREIDTLPLAQAALRGKELAYLSDPVDAMVLHIQGSGRLQITEASGQQRMVRLSFAATNQHTYQSIGRWLLDQKLTQDASWPGIKTWLAANPQRRNELLWANPRYVFFKEEPIRDESLGPVGAQGVPLSAGRSIAVDPQSVPYGTPVWLVSDGAYPLRKLVVAQDTGSAITGAVRADYFVGSGTQAGEVAGRMRQRLQLWALWPRQ